LSSILHRFNIHYFSEKVTKSTTMNNQRSTSTELARIIEAPFSNPSPHSEPTQVFQDDYANTLWGYDPNMGHKRVSELAERDGPALISVHGVFTDSITETNGVKRMASACGLPSYISFESREKPWRGIRTLSPRFYDNAMGIYYTRTAHEVFSLVDCIARVHAATNRPPIVIAHSRGALLLTKAATLWQGLKTIAVDGTEENNQRIPGFMPMWNKLSDVDKKILLFNIHTYQETSIIAITECPAVPQKDPAWKFLKEWSADRTWNFHTSKDWFLIFTRNPSRGYIPALEDHNISFHLQHHRFAGSVLVSKVVASLWKNGRVIGEALDMLMEHHLGRTKLATDTLPVENNNRR